MTPIARFNIANGNKIVFHIKDFPKTWNKLLRMQFLLGTRLLIRPNRGKLVDENMTSQILATMAMGYTDKNSAWSGVACNI